MIHVSKMVYVKSMLAGIGTVLLCAVVIPAVAWMLPTIRYRRGESYGLGFDPSLLANWPVAWVLGLVIFGAAFYWEFQKASRTSHQ